MAEELTNWLLLCKRRSEGISKEKRLVNQIVGSNAVLTLCFKFLLKYLLVF